MPWAVAAVVVGTAVKTYANNKAVHAQQDAANAANKTAQDAATAAIDENRRQYEQNRTDIQPFMERGNQAGNKLQSLMGLGGDAGVEGYGSLMQKFTGDKLEQEPGYQFGLQQGQRGLDNSAAAHGGYYSGAQLKAASRYNSDYAGTKFNDAYNRYNNDQTNTFNRLSGIAGSGQQATSYIGSQGSGVAANNGEIGQKSAYYTGNNLMDVGNARASSYLSNGKNWSNAINNVMSMYSGGKQ